MDVVGTVHSGGEKDVAPVVAAAPARARFQLYEFDDAVFWRLLGRNNWCFGRGTVLHPTLALAEEDARAVSALAPTGDFDVSSDGGRAWTWRLVAGGAPLARSEAAYGRRVECTASIKRFRMAAHDAPIALQVRAVHHHRP